MDFDSLVDDSQAQVQPIPTTPSANQSAPGASANFDDLQDDSETYSTTGQQIKTALEGAAQGVVGPLAPLAETQLGIATPEDIRLRAEANPWTHGLSEAAGFVGGAFTGASEASLVGKVGEGAAALSGLGEATNISSKLAQGAVKLGAEMAAIQAGDEATKAITQDPNQTIGSAAANVGLAGLLGGVTGGAFKGLGMLGGTALEKAGLTPEMLQEFKDRMKYRAANLNPNEAMQNELNQNVSYFRNVGDDVGGFNGLKGAAIAKVLPQTVTPEIGNSISNVSQLAEKALGEMQEKGVPEPYLKKFQSVYNDFLEAATDPNTSVPDHFDNINDFKKQLQDFSKGNWGPFAVPSYKPEYDFLQVTKNLSRDVRMTLEDPNVWGKDAADLQKSLNGAFSKANPFVDQAETKFMSALGNERVVDPAKFTSYVNQAGKATTPTVRQQLLGKFVDSMGDFHDAVESAYAKAGLEAPERPGLGALKDSVSLPSQGSKLADLWYDKLGHYVLGNALGSAVGAAVSPGIAGVYGGRWILGPVFGAILKPVMENVTSHVALDQAVKFGSSILKGDNVLLNATKNLFSGGEMIPKHLMPTAEKTDKLNERVKGLQANQAPLLNVAGNLGHYMPGHAQALSQTAAQAVNYLNAQRPQNPKQFPLDEEAPVSKDQEAAYNRTLEVAQQPLMALHHMQKGTLLPQDVQTLNAIYPAFYQKMSQQLMSSMTEHLAKGETVPYKLKQGLSLFLGQTMDGSLAPASIQAAQAVFAQQRANVAAAMGAAKPKKGTSKLGEASGQYRTAEQAAQARQSQRA